MGGVVIICITTLSCASPNFQSGKFVFATYINETGWNNGVAFILGLLQSTFALVGTDAATHVIDEMPRPHILAPAAMIIAPIIGSLSAFILLIVFLFVLSDFEQVTTSSAGPLLEIIYQAVGNKAGAVVLYIFPVCSMAFAAISILCVSSRQTQAFAIDRGLPFAAFWSKESPRWGVPIQSITMTSVWGECMRCMSVPSAHLLTARLTVIIFGCVYLGSSSALNAILSSSVVMLQLSYSIPIILLLIRGRGLLDEIAIEEEEKAGGTADPTQGQPVRQYNLGRMGYLINLWSVLFAIFTSIL